MSEVEGQTPSRMVAGRYRLESVLGRGGMGVVWLAVDTLIERRVALKELRAPTGVPEGEEASFVERALREARNAGRLNHPAVVAVHDVIAPSDEDDAVYIVMEYVSSPTLAEVLEEHGPLPSHRVAAVGLGILDALMAAHTMGIVHRDIKPGNVLLRDGDRVKLTDFGIALAAEDTRLTRSGVIGTHAYLAPECFDSGQSGPAADLWALGATMFHAVAGQAPFDRETTTATLRAILFEDPPPPPCDPPLAEAITGLLTRPIEHRLTSDASRQLLEKVVAAAPAPAPAVKPPTTAGTGQASWEAQATGVHRPPAAMPASPAAARSWGPPTPTPGPMAPPGPPTPQPAGPSPYVTAQPAMRSPATHSGGGWGGGPAGPPTSGPTYGGGRPPAGASSSYNYTPFIIGGGVALVVVLLLVVVLAAGGGDSSGPKGAVEQLLQAGQDQDLAAAQDALCAEDLSSSVVDGLTSFEIVDFSIGEVEEREDFTVVHVSMETTEDTFDDEEVPVIEEDGDWKVCFSRMLGDLANPPDLSSLSALRGGGDGAAAHVIGPQGLQE